MELSFKHIDYMHHYKLINGNMILFHCWWVFWRSITRRIYAQVLTMIDSGSKAQILQHSLIKKILHQYVLNLSIRDERDIFSLQWNWKMNFHEICSFFSFYLRIDANYKLGKVWSCLSIHYSSKFTCSTSHM